MVSLDNTLAFDDGVGRANDLDLDLNRLDWSPCLVDMMLSSAKGVAEAASNFLTLSSYAFISLLSYGSSYTSKDVSSRRSFDPYFDLSDVRAS